LKFCTHECVTSGVAGAAATAVVGLGAAATTGPPLDPPDAAIDVTTPGAAETTELDGATPKMIGVGDGAAIATDAATSPQRAPRLDSVIAPSKPSTARW
jgi:hypothetical protein